MLASRNRWRIAALLFAGVNALQWFSHSKPESIIDIVSREAALLPETGISGDQIAKKYGRDHKEVVMAMRHVAGASRFLSHNITDAKSP